MRSPNVKYQPAILNIAGLWKYESNAGLDWGNDQLRNSVKEQTKYALWNLCSDV